MRYAIDLDLPTSDDGTVGVGCAAAIEVVRETAKAVLLLLTDAKGSEREQWFPRSVLSVRDCPPFHSDLCASRSFVARNNLWHWTLA